MRSLSTIILPLSLLLSHVLSSALPSTTISSNTTLTNPPSPNTSNATWAHTKTSECNGVWDDQVRKLWKPLTVLKFIDHAKAAMYAARGDSGDWDEVPNGMWQYSYNDTSDDTSGASVSAGEDGSDLVYMHRVFEGIAGVGKAPRPLCWYDLEYMMIFAQNVYTNAFLFPRRAVVPGVIFYALVGDVPAIIEESFGLIGYSGSVEEVVWNKTARPAGLQDIPFKQVNRSMSNANASDSAQVAGVIKAHIQGTGKLDFYGQFNTALTLPKPAVDVVLARASNDLDRRAQHEPSAPVPNPFVEDQKFQKVALNLDIGKNRESPFPAFTFEDLKLLVVAVGNFYDAKEKDFALDGNVVYKADFFELIEVGFLSISRFYPGVASNVTDADSIALS
ncbi:uncharacterized protein KY384_004680 [Bacidia gigantensis]|uniref:uncharacterized protein n=1 Tax=Bacidia gigantensis TaxID=2732470 RepID=UPI001D03EDAE|nr:uncharacterized protein KY384_004680 [Bacidia gigantensis]KAG8530642.1 hypothetical protein KY384_004680 [Bacidia gigantensis]